MVQVPRHRAGAVADRSDDAGKVDAGVAVADSADRFGQCGQRTRQRARIGRGGGLVEGEDHQIAARHRAVTALAEHAPRTGGGRGHRCAATSRRPRDRTRRHALAKNRGPRAGSRPPPARRHEARSARVSQTPSRCRPRATATGSYSRVHTFDPRPSHRLGATSPGRAILTATSPFTRGPYLAGPQVHCLSPWPRSRRPSSRSKATRSASA